jgi:hypothetical protein
VPRLSVVVAALVLLLTACTGTSSGHTLRVTTTTTIRVHADLPTTTTRAQPPRPGAQLVSCDEQIGGGNGPPDARLHAVTIGPVTFWGLADSSLAPIRTVSVGRYQAVKSAVTLTGQEPVTIAIPERERPDVGLLYRRATTRSDGYSPPEADKAVTFQTCGGTETSYAGGFAVAPPARCVVFDMYVGTDEYRITRGVAFGGRVPCGPAP